MKMIIFSGFSYFWYLVPVYQEVTMLFGFLTRWMEALFANVLCDIPVLHTS